jgi:hypothetical protein
MSQAGREFPGRLCFGLPGPVRAHSPKDYRQRFRKRLRRQNKDFPFRTRFFAGTLLYHSLATLRLPVLVVTLL